MLYRGSHEQALKNPHASNCKWPEGSGGFRVSEFFCKHALAKVFANPKPEQSLSTDQTGNKKSNAHDNDFIWLGVGKQSTFMRYGGLGERAPQNPLFVYLTWPVHVQTPIFCDHVCASAWQIKTNVGPTGLKTVTKKQLPSSLHIFDKKQFNLATLHRIN